MSTTEGSITKRDELSFEEFQAEAVELLPERTELSLVNFHVSGVANGNKGAIGTISNTLSL